MREPEKTYDIELDMETGKLTVGVNGGEKMRPLAHLIDYLETGWNVVRSICIGGIVERTVEVTSTAIYEACTGKCMTKWQKIGTRIGASGVGAIAAEASLGLLVRNSAVQTSVEVTHLPSEQDAMFDYEEPDDLREVKDGGEGREEA